MRRRCDHRGGFEEPQRAEIALRLRQKLGTVFVAGVEEEELLDHAAPRLHVQPIGDAVKPSLPRLLGRIDVERVDGDGAEAKWFG